ncbi:MAG: MBL fold metallo-hydrolase [Thermodesulfobacteriota bacterium]
MQIIPHKGTHEIGGTCVELRSGGHGLLLDMGLPLVNPDGSEFDDKTVKRPVDELINSKVLPNVPGLYDDSDCGISGIVLTHAHRDHHGLGHFVKPGVPVLASEVTKKLIGANRLFFPDQIDPARITTLPAWKPVSIGPFTIKAHPVDHSAPGAIAVEVEADGKKVFFTGDLRAHGYKHRLFAHLIVHPPKDVDAMLMEGSSLGRKPGEYPYPDEPAVRDAIIDEIKDSNRLVLLFCAAQNVDRIVTACRAAQATGRSLVIDYYTAYILFLLKEESKNIPQYFWDDIRLLYFHGHGNALADAGHFGFLKALKKRDARIFPDELKANPEKFFVLARANRRLAELTDGLDPARIQCIWSMWTGYLSDPDSIFTSFCQKKNITYKQIHTSGHATIADLGRLVTAVNPGILIPIHTFFPDDYTQFIDPARVKVLNDGEVLDLKILQ